MHVFKIVLMLFLVTMFASCQRKYIRTEKTCAKDCFLEVYERSQLGVSYLTDSINFKVYVGQLNFENEEYRYECKGDTLMIFKYSKDFPNNTNHVVQTKTYSLSQLKKEGKFEN
jgi:hypothetical protein